MIENYVSESSTKAENRLVFFRSIDSYLISCNRLLD